MFCFPTLGDSEPTNSGIPASRSRPITAIVEPLKMGPITTNGLFSMAFRMAATATGASVLVSRVKVSIFLPRMPPAALISSDAICTPRIHRPPTAAPGPLCSMTIPIVTLSACWATAIEFQRITPTMAAMLTTSSLFMVTPFGFLNFNPIATPRPSLR